LVGAAEGSCGGLGGGRDRGWRAAVSRRETRRHRAGPPSTIQTHDSNRIHP
jgi:hypothetical protein